MAHRSTVSRWLADAPWPVLFVVMTVSWGGGVWLIRRLTSFDGSIEGLAVGAPLWAGAMTFVIVRWRSGDRAASGLDTRRHLDAQRAVLRGELPPDPATWPGARALIDRQRDRLRVTRWSP